MAEKFISSVDPSSLPPALSANAETVVTPSEDVEVKDVEAETKDENTDTDEEQTPLGQFLAVSVSTCEIVCRQVGRLLQRMQRKSQPKDGTMI